MSQSSQSIDIGQQQVGKVYAKALLGAAEKDGTAESVLEELAAVVDLLEEHPGFREILASPRIATEEKAGVLERTFGSQVSPVLLRFFKVVNEHGRLDCLRDIYRETRGQFNESQHVIQVIVTTPCAVDDQVLGRIRDELAAKLHARLDVDVQVDPQLIGGIVIRIGDQVYDGSVAQKLRLLRDEALHNVITEMREATDKFATSDA